MGYLDQLIQFNAYQDALSGKIKGAYAAYYAPYEVQTPQTPIPNPYTLATQGYRKNSLIYAAINYRATAISEARLIVQDVNAEGDEEELENHPLKELIYNPNPAMTEEQFWQVAEINLLIAGFSAWEIELSNGGEPLALWPMRSDWCQFYRGIGQPLRAVRYQPYGLPPVDIPIEKILLFQYYDPIYPLLKGLSPLGVALNIVDIDNFATEFLRDFMHHGAMPQGLLTTDQALNKPDADDLRERWMNQHGGAENWSKPAVLGKGVTYQNTGAQFSPGFDFSKLDGRDESRMCMAIGVEPILIGAQVGLQASTYSNYEEARKAFYQARIAPEWRYLASEVREQLLPLYETAKSKFTIIFDSSEVAALQEDQTIKWQRATAAWQANGLTLDEYRGELGLDPVESVPSEKRIWYTDTLTIREQFGNNAPANLDDITAGKLEEYTGESIQLEEKPKPQLPASMSPNGQQLNEQNGKQDNTQTDQQTKDEAAQELERKQLKAYIRHRGSAQGFTFKHLPSTEQEKYLTEAQLIVEAQGSDTPETFQGAQNWPTYP